jgi:RES domain-containing protein
MRTWRLCQERFAKAAFSGEGTRLYSGRWHWPGTPLVYTATSLALAALEVLVHFDHDLVPGRFVAFAVEIPAALRLQRLTAKQLPSNWRALPAPDETKDLGTNWLKAGKTVGLVVPSALVPQEQNILVNPQHPDFARLRIAAPEPFPFDPRLRRT